MLWHTAHTPPIVSTHSIAVCRAAVFGQSHDLTPCYRTDESTKIQKLWPRRSRATRNQHIPYPLQCMHLARVVLTTNALCGVPFVGTVRPHDGSIRQPGRLAGADSSPLRQCTPYPIVEFASSAPPGFLCVSPTQSHFCPRYCFKDRSVCRLLSNGAYGTCCRRYHLGLDVHTV